MRIIFINLLLIVVTTTHAQFNDQRRPDLRTTFPTLPAQLRSLKDSLTQKMPVAGLQIESTSSKPIRLRCGSIRTAGMPLLVADGTVMKFSDFSSIDINTICDITALNGISGSAIFGPDGANGVIVVTTDSKTSATIRIQDQYDRSFIPGATVRFISSDKKDTLMYVADSAGLVSRKDLMKGKLYDILVTATGYKSFSGSVSAIRSRAIELDRDFITGPEVIISSGIVCRCSRRCGGHIQQISQGCGVQTKLINDQRSDMVMERVGNFMMSVFPNPVQRGQQVTLKLLDGYFPSGLIRVITMDGKQVLSVPVNGSQKQGLIQVPMLQGWAPGVYIFQLVYANGRPGASEKVILQ